jgi:hypothetical protein
VLFDLRGRRRRAVQATYLMLAFLMGGGLVFFGIGGGGLNGGLFDAFSGSGGGGGGNSALEKRIEREQKRLQANPADTAALKALVRDEYQLAAGQTEASSVGFPAEAKDELQKSGAYWQRYLKAEKGDPDPSLATVAIQIYDPTALNKPKQAQEAARIVAEAQDDPAAYLRLVQYAGLAGDTRTADLAAQKAVDLAPEDQKQAVKRQAETLKKPQTQAQGQG